MPKEPITLKKAEEMELMRSIGESLKNHDMDVLKKIYNELSSSYDQSLTGWAMLSDVAFVLQHCQVLHVIHSRRVTYSLHCHLKN